MAELVDALDLESSAHRACRFESDRGYKMVYVDPAVWKKPNGRVYYCHMTADSLEELHTFAATIGVKRCWFHRGSRYPHYDVNADKRLEAIASGAVELEAKQVVEIAKKLYVRRTRTSR